MCAFFSLRQCEESCILIKGRSTLYDYLPNSTTSFILATFSCFDRTKLSTQLLSYNTVTPAIFHTITRKSVFVVFLIHLRASHLCINKIYRSTSRFGIICFLVYSLNCKYALWGSRSLGHLYLSYQIFSDFLKPAEVLLENWAGLCGALPKTLTLFETKICDFPYPIWDQTLNLFRPVS